MEKKCCAVLAQKKSRVIRSSCFYTSSCEVRHAEVKCVLAILSLPQLPCGDLCEHSQFSLGALVHRFFLEPGYLQVGDTGTVSGLRLGARQCGFKKTSQSCWPVKERTQCGLATTGERRDRSWHRSIL